MSSTLDLAQLLQTMAAQQGGSQGSQDVSSALINMLLGQPQSSQNQSQQGNPPTTTASHMQQPLPQSSQQQLASASQQKPQNQQLDSLQLQRSIEQLQQQQDLLQNQLNHKQAQKQQLEQQQHLLLQQTQTSNLLQNQQQNAEGGLDIRKLLFQALQGNTGTGTNTGSAGQTTPQLPTSLDLSTLLATVGKGSNLGLAGLLGAANAPAPPPQPVASAPAAAAPGSALNPTLQAIVDLVLKQNQDAPRQSSGNGLRVANIVNQTMPQPSTQGPAPAPSVAMGSAPAASANFDLLLKNQNSTAALGKAAVPNTSASFPGFALQQKTATPNLAALSPAPAPRSPNSTLGSGVGSSLNDVFALRLASQLQQGNQIGKSAAPGHATSFLQPQSLRSSPEVSTPNTSLSVSSDSMGGGVPTVSSSNDSVPSIALSKDSHDGIEAHGVDPSYPLTGIEYPGQNDCMFGRGGGTSNHIGNINFRLLVEKFKKRYAETSKLDKPHVAELVVRQWRARNPPGRFLARTNPEEGTMSKWHDVGDKRARRKCAQALREKHGRCWDESCNVEPPPVDAPAAKRARIN